MSAEHEWEWVVGNPSLGLRRCQRCKLYAFHSGGQTKYLLEDGVVPRACRQPQLDGGVARPVAIHHGGHIHDFDSPAAALAAGFKLPKGVE